MITAAQLTALHVANPTLWAPLLSKAIADNTIRNTTDFLANLLHESARLSTLRESLNYDAAGLRRAFPTHFTPAQAAEFGRIGPANAPSRAADQWHIAERAYGDRFGNRPIGYGDGWAFRGTGPLQNTGRDNITAFGTAIGWTGTPEDLADKMATPEFGAAAAGQFWRAKGCDACTTPTATRVRVNGGTNGLAEVLALRLEVARALGMVPTAPPKPPAYDPDNSADDLNALSLERARTT